MAGICVCVGPKEKLSFRRFFSMFNCENIKKMQGGERETVFYHQKEIFSKIENLT